MPRPRSVKTMCRSCSDQTAPSLAALHIGRGFGTRVLFAGLAMLSLVMSGCGMMPSFGDKSQETTSGAPAKSSKRRGAPEEAAGAAVEAPLPPEAVQQFDKAVS